MHLDLQNTAVGDFNYEFLRTISTQVTGFAELGEALTVAQRIQYGDFNSWIIEWIRVAERVTDMAETYLRRNQPVTAREAFMRASNYYRAAVFYASYADPRHKSLWSRSRECFHKAIGLMSPSVEVIEIPFEGVNLPGYFVSGGDGQRPTLLAMGGFDSTAEEIYHWIAVAAAKRGWNCLIFEGPGQWSAMYLTRLKFRHDYEVPGRAVVDYALSRPDVDAERLALIGYSLGGYFAPRIAAYDKRIKACIANSLVPDAAELFQSNAPALVRHSPTQVQDAIFGWVGTHSMKVHWAIEHARWTLGIDKPHELLAAFELYTLRGLEKRMQCPFLNMYGEDEIKQGSAASVVNMIRFASQIAGKTTTRLFTREASGSSASHCQMGGASLAQAVIFDWLEQVFSAEGAMANPVPSELIAISKRHHGDDIMRELNHMNVMPTT